MMENAGRFENDLEDKVSQRLFPSAYPRAWGQVTSSPASFSRPARQYSFLWPGFLCTSTAMS